MATSSYDAGRTDAADYDVAGGGWITFSAVLLGLLHYAPFQRNGSVVIEKGQPRFERFQP